MGDYTQEDNKYLNFVQIKGVFEFAIGLVLFLILGNTYLPNSFNSYTYRLLAFGLSIDKVNMIAGMAACILYLIGIFIYSLVAMYFGTKQIGCIYILPKKGKDIAGRQYALVWVADILCIVLVVLQFVFKMPIGTTSYIVAVAALAHILVCAVLNNLRNKVAKDFPQGHAVELSNSSAIETE